MTEVTQKRIPFSDLVFMEDNPRRISETDFEALVESIRKDPAFFDNRPCLVNHTGGKFLVYAGFQRAHAAHMRLGWQEIPCSIEADVPEAVMRERAIRDNTHQGTWDSDVLSSWEFDVPELREFGVPEFVFGEGGGLEAEEESGGTPVGSEAARKPLAERFIIPPFSVFDTRQGYWQTRKRQWLALGIKSELGRGGAMTYNDHEWQREKLGKVQAFTGGGKR